MNFRVFPLSRVAKLRELKTYQKMQLADCGKVRVWRLVSFLTTGRELVQNQRCWNKPSTGSLPGGPPVSVATAVQESL